MDTVLQDGDFVKDGRGCPVMADGVQALLQRILLRLAVKQGSFVYDRSLGSRLYTLKAASAGAKLEQKAFELVREALKDMPGVVPRRVEARLSKEGTTMDLHVLLTVNRQQAEVEVSV